MENKQRQIIHIDMDAFYASIEQRDKPELRGQPVVVGGDPNGRGVASTCSYEARKYGIRSAMPLAEAKRRCPHAVFLPVDMAKYAGVSAAMQQIFAAYTPLIEPISLDEAFLDVTASTLLFGPARDIALTIKRRIREELQLTASVGLAPNKFLAKIASDLQKPDGFVLVGAEEIQDFLDPLPVEKIWGVGPKTAEKLHTLRIKTVKELRRLDQAALQSYFGTIGTQLYHLARGMDSRPVEPERDAKSIGKEITFPQDLSDSELLETFILDLAAAVGRRLRRESLKARTVTLKVRFADFRTISRSKTLELPTNQDKDIFTAARRLFAELRLTQPVRLIGVTGHNLLPDDVRLSLFETEDQQKEALTRTIDSINERFGEKSLTPARLLHFQPRKHK